MSTHRIGNTTRIHKDDFAYISHPSIAVLNNGDLGYPTTIEYAPGKLFVCYYGQTSDGVTCVMGTYVEI